MSSSSVVIENPAAGVVKIILNRPKALNALNVELLDGLVKALRENSHARVIILEGAGDRSFCAGEDLKQTLAPKTGTAQELREAFHQLQDLTRLTSGSQAVVIAAVHGFAIGGGAEIALAADFIIGGPATKYRFPEVPIGHAATGGITLRLSHLVGLLKAKELLLTGRWIESAEALRIGLLSEISDDPKARALELAMQIAKLPAISLAASKSSLERSLFTNMEACLQDEVNVASYCFAQSDAAKAFTDFAARKAPQSSGTEKVESKSEPGLNGTKSPNGAASLSSSAPIRDINTALGEAIKKFPDQTFLRFAGQDITFKTFDTMVSKLAGGLKQLGIGQDDRVLVMMSNSIEMVCTWMAVNRLGATWAPVNTELKSVTLRNVIQAAQPKLAVVDSVLWPKFHDLAVLDSSFVVLNGEAQDSLANLSDLLNSNTMVCVENSIAVSPNMTAAFLYTSGTTGKSKPCVLSHEYFILQARVLIEGCGLRSDDVLYCPFPLFHADATALTVIPAILLGCVAALSVRFSASRFWDEIRTTKATIYDFMGATLALTYKQPPSDRDREHNVRLAWGVPIPYFAEDYEKRFGHPLVTLYGSVEASLPVFQDRSMQLPRGSCGRLRKGHQLRIANEMDEELPANTPGHLLLRSDRPNAFFQGYFNDPTSTANALRGLWLHTGDLGKVDEAGNVYFIGRIKDVVRRRGENINALEVEEEFLQHPDVVIAAAFGVPSQLGTGTEEDLKVVVTLRPSSTLTEKELWEWAAQHMARFQVPSIIEFVDEITKTPTGKVEKRNLKMDGGCRFDFREMKR